MSFDLYLFDFDGTLLDSRHDIADGINHALRQFGRETLDDNLITSFIGRGVKNLIADSLGKENPEDIALLRRYFLDYYGQNYLKKSRLYDGVEDLLASLSDKEIALVTNKPEGLSREILKKLGIDHYFQYIVGGDTYEKPKPHPIVLEDILKRTKSQSDRRIFIGDSGVDIQTAQSVQMQVCAVSYGYRPIEELSALNPDFLVHSVSALSHVLKGE